MFIKNLFPVFVFLLVSVLFFSCKKDEEPPLSDLNFQVVHVGNGIYDCKWNASNISTFKNYYIVHSPFILGIDDDPKSIYYKRSTMIGEQTRDNQGLFVENNYGLPLHFQLFIDIGDRYVRSNVVSLETPNSETIDIDVLSAIHYPEKNGIYLINNGFREVAYYDYEEKQLKVKNEVDFIFDAPTAQVGNNGFGEEIYAIDNNDLYILDANTLELKEELAINGLLHSVATNNDGWIAVTVQNYRNKIQIFSRENLTHLNDLSSINTYNDSRGITFLSEENNELIEIGDNVLKLFKLDENGIAQDSSETSNPFESSNTRGHMFVSPSGNYFVNSRKGHVFDSDLNEIVELYSLSGLYYYYSKYFFNKDETFLYAIPNGSDNFIDKFSIPDFELVDRKEFVNGIPLELFYRNEEIQVAIFTNDFNCMCIQPLNF